MEQLRIRTEEGTIAPLKFTESQEILWDEVAPDLDTGERLWYIVLKGRQVYATTFFEALGFTRTLEKPNTNSLVIAQDLDSAVEIFDMVKRFYDFLAMPKLEAARVREVILPIPGGNSNFKVVSAGTAAKGRGTTKSVLHCSEVAFWEHPEVLLGLSQALPDLPNTMWVLESTANGMIGHGEMFYRQWKDAQSGLSKMKPIFIPWYVMNKYREDPGVPEEEWDEEEKMLMESCNHLGLDERSLRWRRNIIVTKCQGFVEKFHQEYPSTPSEAFISTGLPAFDPLAILYQEKYLCRPRVRGTFGSRGQFLPRSDGEVFIWKSPQEGHDYAIGVDTAEGLKGGDFACAQVIDMNDLEQVALIHGLIQPFEFSRILNHLGRLYKGAMLNIEIASAGIAVQDYMLRVWNYPRYHPWRGKPDRAAPTQMRLFGWSTNVHSRPLLIESGRRAINNRLITLHDRSTVDEITHFSRQDDGKYAATAGHDDRVMALLLALRSREENFTPISRLVISSGAVTDLDVRGVRTVDVLEAERVGLRRVHQDIKKKAREAVKHFWM